MAKAAGGRLIILPGSCDVVWWYPLHVWQRFVDGQFCFLCLLLKQFDQRLLLLTMSNRWLGLHFYVFGNRDRWLVYGFHDISRKNALVDLRCFGVEMAERYVVLQYRYCLPLLTDFGQSAVLKSLNFGHSNLLCDFC